MTIKRKIAVAGFDFVESASHAYRFLWVQRSAILRFSAMALAIKILSLIALVVFGLQEFSLRQGLYLLPSFFIEGWAIATLVIMALHEHEARSETRKSILAPGKDTARNIKAAMIVYVLTKLMLSFVVGSVYGDQQAAPEAAASEPSMQSFFMALVIIAFMIWAFRFLWIYIPVVMGRSVREYLARFRAYSDSFPMLGVWILCFVPAMIALKVLAEMFGGVMNILGFGSETIVFESGLAMIQALADYLLSLLSSLAVAYGMYSVFNNENKKTEIW